MKKTIAVALVLALALVLLAACGSNNSLVGTWSGTIIGIGDLAAVTEYTFNADGTYTISGMGATVSGTYSVDGSKLTTETPSP